MSQEVTLVVLEEIQEKYDETQKSGWEFTPDDFNELVANEKF